jgi:Zn-dependent protease with chaperone function
VEQISGIELSIEKILSSRLGSPIFSLSKAIFLFAPLLLVLYISYTFRNRFYLWNIAAILALYSLEIFVFNMVGSVHGIPGMWKYFGYLFVVLVPITFFFSRYEESEAGQRGIKEFFDKITELIASLFR